MDKQLKKIVLIGPVYPYKGGISHYTGLMYQALSSKYDVTMVSYKMQYPKFLFKKEQKDYSNDTFKIDGTKYWIHTANPLNLLRTAGKIRAEKPDLVIFQWWHPYFAPCYWILCRLLGKCRILFVCHNVFPHERFPMDRFLTKLVLRRGDYFIVQSEMDKRDLLTIKKDALVRRTVHPIHNEFLFENMSLKEGRRRLGIQNDRPVLLFFGFVRPYKGLGFLLKAMPKIIEEFPDVILMVVGEFDGNKEEYFSIIQEENIKKNVEIYDGYIPDREIEPFFSASDLVVLPYISATQSGIVQISYSFGKPVVVTRVGGLPEVVTEGKTGYIVPPEDSESLANGIIKFLAEDNKDRFTANIAHEAYKYSWDRMTELIQEMWEE